VTEGTDHGLGAAVAYLPDSDEPAVRFLARRDLLGEECGELRPGTGWRSRPGAELGFGIHPYRKWTGAHWRLVWLVELGVSAASERA
jgi:hypothetical protein